MREAIDNLDRQGRVHEIVGREERLSEISREYAREPQGTLVISPDNESRRELNGLIHREMKERGDVSQDEHKLRVLDSRQEMTGADRQWAGQYEAGDVVRYTRGSKVLGIEPGEYARVEQVEHIARPIAVFHRFELARPGRLSQRDHLPVNRLTESPTAISFRGFANQTVQSRINQASGQRGSATNRRSARWFEPRLDVAKRFANKLHDESRLMWAAFFISVT